MLNLTKRFYSITSLILLVQFSSPVISQIDFHEITERQNEIQTLGGGQQFTDKWPIPELSPRIKTIVLTATNLTEIDVDKFVKDMNSNPRITMLEIQSSLDKDLTPGQIQKIPLRQLKYIKHLAFSSNSYKSIPFDSIISWKEIIEMPALKFLYLEPFGKHGYWGHEVTMPFDVAKALSNKLKGYVNYGYGGEMDEVSPKFEYLGIGVKAKQSNQSLDILKNCQNLKELIISIDTISDESVNQIFTTSTLESLRIDKLNIDYPGRPNITEGWMNLPSLKSLECSAFHLPMFQPIASQLKSLYVNLSKDHNSQTEDFLSSSTSLKNLTISAYGDSLIRITLNPDMPLIRLEIKGRLKELPDDICKFSKLEELYLRFNKLESLPACFSELKRIKIVDLGYNHLIAEPPLRNWKKLEELYLNDNIIGSITDIWCNNRKLKKLILKNNPLDGRYESLSCLTDLEELDLSNTCTSDLPKDIHKLKSLRVLNLSKYPTESFDNKPKTKCDTSIISIPENISALSNLSLISFQRHKFLNEKDLDILFNIQSDSVVIDLSHCDIDSLPNLNWQNQGIISLDLSHNNIKELPSEIYQTSIPNLNLTGNELGKLNQHFTNETEKLIWKYTAGLDVSDELSKQDDLIDAVVKIGNKFYSRPSENPILVLMPLVMKIDTLEVLSRISAKKYGEALFEANRFRQAEKYLSLAIQRQKEGCAIFVNSIVDLYYDRHICYLEMKDTLSAIQDLYTISNDYGYFVEPAIFELELQRGNIDQVENLKPIIIKKFEERKQKASGSKKVGLALTILEIYLLTNDYNGFEAYKQSLSLFNMSGSKPIYFYLKLLKNVANDQHNENDIRQLENMIMETEFENKDWSCRMVKYWATQFTEEKTEIIKTLNSLICPN